MRNYFPSNCVLPALTAPLSQNSITHLWTRSTTPLVCSGSRFVVYLPSHARPYNLSVCSYRHMSTGRCQVVPNSHCRKSGIHHALFCLMSFILVQLELSTHNFLKTALQGWQSLPVIYVVIAKRWNVKGCCPPRHIDGITSLPYRQ
ncbi:hypothetical protein KC19_4G251200 [Ceratodon purpureus]|uniref:Uncharacterized protein n=1 Tax=Ceratodon purpureus TaxID=3225 RepID=A0A8T0IG17_CERPU|nr:hypothetical protein KC19_4G251200 [Ceratodon purpureus]